MLCNKFCIVYEACVKMKLRRACPIVHINLQYTVLSHLRVIGHTASAGVVSGQAYNYA